MSKPFLARFPFAGATEVPPDAAVPGFSLLTSSAAASAFVPDARFGSLPLPVVVTTDEAEAEPTFEEAPVDPVVGAFEEGFAAGYEQACREAQLNLEADQTAHDKLELSFARLDAVLEEELRLRLRDTVAALCEAAIAPLVLDEEALLRRIAMAASMLARADDERVIRLHPHDLKLVADRLYSDWNVQPDATLERGTIRIEGVSGGVEDGPATWRRAIGEALQQC